MKLWVDFHPRVMPYVLGCPIPVVDTALIDAAREFCHKTLCWKQTELAYVSGQTLFEFDMPFGTELVKVGRVRVNGKEYDIKTSDDLPEDWDSNTPDDKTLYQDNQLEYRIFPVPTAADEISMTLHLKPSADGIGVDDEVFSMYSDAIAAGARAMLQRMPRTAWFDMTQAAVDGQAFMSRINYAANLNFMRSKHHRVAKAGL
ncbi:hypothetical protein KBW71_03265 [Hydrogenophaga aromaticivorans]|uniref:hypothetical protein n=1 Tax=Hydrogenophaga aromaticivorans TaxID=2610898 RepID=UPI001B36149C|nr:hypothetical protein [Hydrogenophaga aromaticivorans]MBQ0917448.1 hypothetical protein [Hydrogenophaga aromaticivorans]